MKCPICGKGLELQKKQIGTSENGDPIFNEYAICRDCKKQWNLDKQRAKKMAARKAATQTSAKTEQSESDVQEEVRQAKAPEKKVVKEPEEHVTEKKPVKAKRPVSSHVQEEHERQSVEKKPVKKRAACPAVEDVADETVERTEKKPVKKRSRTEDDSAQRPAKKHVERRSEASAERIASGKKPVKKRHVEEHSEESEERKYANVPSEKVRAKREKAVRKGYEDMISTDPDSKSSRKKKSNELSERKKADKKELIDDYENDDYENDNYKEDDYYDGDYEIPRFRPLRILLGILSLVGFGFCIYKGFVAGLNSTAADIASSTGMIYVVLALCMLVSALLYFIMRNRYTIFSFLLPMLFYLASAVFGFLKRGDEMEILIIAGASAVLAILSLILAIASRGGDEYYEDEDEDNAFDDDDDYED